MASGEISRLITEQGIGYIRAAGDDEELPFNAIVLMDGLFDCLRIGQKVEFERQAYSRTGTSHRAIKVRVEGMPS